MSKLRVKEEYILLEKLQNEYKKEPYNNILKYNIDNLITQIKNRENKYKYRNKYIVQNF